MPVCDVNAMVDVMSSDEGEKVLLNFIERNPKKIKSLLQ